MIDQADSVADHFMTFLKFCAPRVSLEYKLIGWKSIKRETTMLMFLLNQEILLMTESIADVNFRYQVRNQQMELVYEPGPKLRRENWIY